MPKGRPRSKKTATPTGGRWQQKRKPSSALPASPQPSVTAPKRTTTGHGVTQPTQPKRARTAAHTLTTDDIPGIVQAVINALPTISSPPPNQGQTLTSRSSRREDSTSSTSTPHSEDNGTQDFGTLHCLTYAA